MKLLAFGASNSKSSINRALANHAASLVPGARVTLQSVADYTLPLYCPELENSDGVPAPARAFLETIRNHDAIVLSLAEHNGSYTAAFKNLLDWTSRVDTRLWSGKPMLLLATSPGARGGATVLAAAQATFPRLGANLAGTFSLPSFYDNFADGKVTRPALADALRAEAAKLRRAIP